MTNIQEREIKPCPWCGEVPDVSKNESFRLTDGVKYGALQCCVVGPEVRTGYKDLQFWRDDAIEAWNCRAPQAPSVAVPKGYALVPVEPTEAMMHAAEDVPSPRPYGAVYQAMVAASRVACRYCNDTGDLALGPTDHFGNCAFCPAAAPIEAERAAGGEA